MNLEVRDKAYEDYLAGIKYKDIAQKHGVSISAIKSWVKRYWKVATNRMEGCNQDKKLQPRRKCNNPAPRGNKYAVGNSGGPPPRNRNAVTHGLYSKYLPEETLEIAEGLETVSPIDLLWDNIKIQYAVILRAQRIMHVTDKDELIKYVKSDGINATTYEFQYAWDRQAKFMAAQSRAMATLNNMIKQYDELCRSDLATEEQRLRVEKVKADMKINKERLELERQKLLPPAPEDLPDDGFIDALKSESSAIWADNGGKDD